MRLNNNIAALNTYMSLIRTGNKIDSSMKRLSSGYRINSVKDDPAGLAISNKMKNQIRGLDMANRNSMDGVSLVQTADGAFQEMHNMIKRIRDLAVQASNDTLEPNDRRKSQEEVEQLLKELDDTAFKTEFNKIKILNGDASRMTKTQTSYISPVKVTYVSDDVDISPNTDFVLGDDSGLEFEVTSVGLPAVIEIAGGWNTADPIGMNDHKLKINGEIIIIESGDSAEILHEKFKELIDRIGGEIVEMNGGIAVVSKESGEHIHFNASGSSDVMEWFFGAQGVATDNIVEINVTGTDAVITSATYNGSDLTAVIEGNMIYFTGPKNEKITAEVQVEKIDSTGTVELKNGAGNNVDTAVLNYGQLILQIGPNKDMEMNVQIPHMDTKSIGLEFVSVKSIEESQRAIELCDKAESFLSNVQSKLGAYQNRLEHTVKSLDVTAESTRTALSRIFDTDMAWEMTQLTQSQVISQAAMSIMGQANQRPQALLQIMG